MERIYVVHADAESENCARETIDQILYYRRRQRHPPNKRAAPAAMGTDANRLRLWIESLKPFERGWRHGGQKCAIHITARGLSNRCAAALIRAHPRRTSELTQGRPELKRAYGST
jgi:hypothetical protein